MAVSPARRGDVVRIRRLDCDIFVAGRNRAHREQIWGHEIEGKKLGRIRIFTDAEVVAKRAQAGMQFLLMDEADF